MHPALRRRRQRLHPGLARGLVVDVADPLQQRRVQVSLPSIPRSGRPWASTVRDLSGPPAVGDEVIVGFESGDPARPCVLGVLATTARPVEITDAAGNAVRLTASGIELSTSGEVKVDASTIRFTSAQGSADAGEWTFSGVVRSQTLVTESVVASSYTPGTGNLS